MEENKIEEVITENDSTEAVAEVAKHVPEEKSFSWSDFWDKVTTGLLILFLASPILVLAYIFIWFITK